MTDFLPIHDRGTIVSSATRSGIGDMGVSTWPTKAVVLAVYYPEEDTRTFADKHQRCITCDVRTIGLKPRYLSRVPVYQRAHGLFDEDLFVPRAATQDISGGSLATEQGSGKGVQPTPAENTDASVVLIGFLDGSPAQPFIYPCEIPHLKARNLPSKTDGRVKRFRHAGVLMEWSEDGDWTLDASGAAKQTLGAKGTETSNSGTAGIITVKTNDGSNDSSIVLDNDGSIKVLDGNGSYLELDASGDAVIKASAVIASASSVKLGGSAATEPLLMGTLWESAETIWYGLLAGYLNLLGPSIDILAQKAQGLSGSDRINVAKAGATATGPITGAGFTTWKASAAASKSSVSKTL